MLLRVALVLIQPILQFQGQGVIVGPYHFQNLPETEEESASTAALALEEQGCDRAELWHLFLQHAQL